MCEEWTETISPEGKIQEGSKEINWSLNLKSLKCQKRVRCESQKYLKRKHLSEKNHIDTVAVKKDS